MTTEVVIGNRQAVALAADSAVTVGNDRVWKTANKLFSLGPTNDVGVMINGSGDYLGLSWEVIIKLYREHIGEQKFATVNECAVDFIAFFSGEQFRNVDAERLSFASIFVEHLEKLKSHLSYNSKAEFRANIASMVDAEVVHISSEWIKISDQSISEFRRIWRELINALAKDILGEVITKRVSDAITKLLHAVIVHSIESELATGLVIAGFGAKEMYPNMLSYYVDGACDGVPRVWPDRAINLNQAGNSGGYIVPFGQSDIVYSFMEGITLQSSELLEVSIPALLEARSDDLIRTYVPAADREVEAAIQQRQNSEAYRLFKEGFDRFRKASITNPVVSVLSKLPKEELADMAQAMVELTSLRRRVDSSLETVGGPVDLAIISKGDGFIWLKRKNYFELDANRDFLYRRYRWLERPQ